MEITKEENCTIRINLKRVQLILGIVALIIIQFIQPIIGAVVDKNSAETTIQNHENRITTLETNEQTNHELLLEIRWNLRNHMNAAGQEYLESNPNRK